MSLLDAFGRRVLQTYFGLDTSSQESLLDTLVSQELAGGEWLFHQGDASDGLYFVIRGRLQVWRETASGHPSELLGEVVPGESVGEVGLLTDAPRSAGTRAVRDSLLVRVDKQAFDALAGRHPELVMRLAASVAQRLQHNTAAGRRLRPELSSVAIILMDDDPELLAVADGLVDALTDQGRALGLRLEALAGLGAPSDVTVTDADLAPTLKHWIGGLEQTHGRIVFRASPGDGAWLRYAARQADLVVRLAAADSACDLRDWETELGAHLRAGFDARQALLLWHRPGRSTIQNTAAWLAPRPNLQPLHLRADHRGDQQRVLRVLTDQATGLVLSGGAARGFAHLGVYRALAELGIPIDWVGGTSMGSIMAFTMAADWGVEEAIAKVRTAFVGGRPFNDYTLPVISLLRGGRMQRLAKAYFPGDIEDLPLPSFCVSSNLSTGEPNIHERGSVWQAICASAALPGVMPPAVHEGQLAVDGAMLNNLPVDVMQEKLVRRVVAVDLTSRRQVDVPYDEVPSPWAVLAGRLLPFVKRQSVPGAATMMLKATELGTRRRVLELAGQADLLLQPPVHRFSMLSVQQFDELVTAGYDHAMERASSWLAEGGLEQH